MTRVIHTGQALVDVVIEVPDLPERGQNVMATSVTDYAGGAVTVLVAAARFGVRKIASRTSGSLRRFWRTTNAPIRATAPARTPSVVAEPQPSTGARTIPNTARASPAVTAMAPGTSIEPWRLGAEGMTRGVSAR